MVISVNANGASLHPLIVMTAVIQARREHYEPTEARTNSAQLLSWKNCALAVNAFEFNSKEFPDMREKQTMAGLPLELDSSLDFSTIEFRDAKGTLVARIEDLAIPTNFTPADSRSQPAPTTRALPPQDVPPDDLG